MSHKQVVMAGTDARDLTKLAVAAYQKDNGLEGDGVIDLAMLRSLFADDKNVMIEE